MPLKRRRLASPPRDVPSVAHRHESMLLPEQTSGSPATATPRPTWFDTLSPALLTNVARNISDTPSPDLFNFFRVSPSHRLPVIFALRHDIHFDNSLDGAPDERVIGLDDLTRYGVRSLSLLQRNHEAPKAAPFQLCPLRFKAPELQAAAVHYSTGNILALRNAPKLRELHLTVQGDVDPRSLCHDLSRLRLNCLSLVCTCARRDTKKCILNDLSSLPTGANELATACPNVVHLGLDCASSNDLGSLLKGFHNLKSLETSIAVGPAALPLVRTLKDVNLVETEQKLSVAAEIGLPVVALTSQMVETYHGYDDIAILRACPELEELSINIQRGAESALNCLLPTLRSLELCWEGIHPDVDGLEIAEDKYYRLSPRSITSLVQSFPLLERLIMDNVMISNSVLRDLLKALGPRLKTFGVSLMPGKDALCTQYRTVFESLVAYNHSLEELQFLGDYTTKPCSCWDSGDSQGPAGGVLSTDIFVRCREANKRQKRLYMFERSQQVFNRRFPFVRKVGPRGCFERRHPAIDCNRFVWD